MKTKTAKIKSIKSSMHTEYVYNLELVSERPIDQDDLFFVANGIITHNCFVKDINALRHKAQELGVDTKMLDAAWAKNEDVRPERDWIHLVGRAVTKKD